MTALILTIILGLTVYGAAAWWLIRAVGFSTSGEYPTPPARDTTDQWDVAA